MAHYVALIRRRADNEKGQGMVETGLILALVVIVAVGALGALGGTNGEGMAQTVQKLIDAIQ